MLDRPNTVTSLWRTYLALYQAETDSPTIIMPVVGFRFEHGDEISMDHERQVLIDARPVTWCRIQKLGISSGEEQYPAPLHSLGGWDRSGESLGVTSYRSPKPLAEESPTSPCRLTPRSPIANRPLSFGSMCFLG
jgi:hypothetical protein